MTVFPLDDITRELPYDGGDTLVPLIHSILVEVVDYIWQEIPSIVTVTGSSMFVPVNSIVVPPPVVPKEGELVEILAVDV